MSALAAVAYALFLLFMVLRLFRSRTESALEYIVAGRRLTLPAFTASLVTTWYGGILGVGEYTWQHGISNWLVFGVPYYLYAGIFALFLAGRARRSEALTIPDLMENSYGRPAALVAAGVLFIMTAPAAYVLMLGVLVNFATGWPLWVGVVLGTGLSIGYVFRGGLKAVVATDIVQFFLMFISFLVLVPVCVKTFGGWDFLKANLPASHLQWDGGLGFQAVAVWYFIAMATLVEPAFYQRCYAARTERTASAGGSASRDRLTIRRSKSGLGRGGTVRPPRDAKRTKDTSFAEESLFSRRRRVAGSTERSTRISISLYPARKRMAERTGCQRPIARPIASGPGGEEGPRPWDEEKALAPVNTQVASRVPPAARGWASLPVILTGRSG